MRLVLNGKKLMQDCDAKNPYQVTQKTGISATTTRKYLLAPDSIVFIDLSVLLKILIDGMGLDVESVLNLRLGDIFEIKE
jgi:hypothetical protein